MSKTDQLESLFDKWREMQKNEPKESLQNTMLKDAKIVEYNFFCKDGIVCEKEYDNEPVKVLFIANEPNIENKSNIVNGKKPNPESSQLNSFIEYYESHKDDWSGKLRKRICEILFPSIINLEENEFPVKNGWENAKKIAFMNLNKRGGNGSIADHLKHYCEYYKEYINREICIIDPDVIIWLGKNSFDMCFNTVFNNFKSMDDYYCVTIDDNDMKKTYPLICTYHTSARKSDVNRAMDIQNKYKKIKM